MHAPISDADQQDTQEDATKVDAAQDDQPDPVDVFCTTPLHEAAAAGNDECVRQLLVDGHKINPLD